MSSFLRKNGARRIRVQHDSSLPVRAEEVGALHVDLDAEVARGQWKPIATRRDETDAWLGRPSRFVGGRDAGRAVAWMQSSQGCPVPLRLAEIGAVALRVSNEDGGRVLKREWAQVERVVSFRADLFAWDEIEEFAISLRSHGFRLLAVIVDENTEAAWDFERAAQHTRERSQSEVHRLQARAMNGDGDAYFDEEADAPPILVDGSLAPRRRAFPATASVVGLVSSTHDDWLHPLGWRVFYDLQAGERTPAFTVGGELDVVSWYLRLDGGADESVSAGIVRLEMPLRFFQSTAEGDWNHVNRVSRLICDYRCRGETGDAPRSIYPVARGAQTLDALFSHTEQLAARFYRLTEL